jgi:adenylate kinase family enzyme
MQNLGSKIVVVGLVASGKSTFTRTLAEKTKLPAIFVDTIFWKSNWNYIGDEAAIKELDTLSQASKWIIEGYMIPEIKAIVFNRADTIIFLDYSRTVTLFRYIKRWWQHRKNPRPELNGNTERFRWKMVKRIWQKEESIRLHTLLKNPALKNKVVHLVSPTETEKFLNNCSI